MTEESGCILAPGDGNVVQVATEPEEEQLSAGVDYDDETQKHF